MCRQSKRARFGFKDFKHAVFFYRQNAETMRENTDKTIKTGS